MSTRPAPSDAESCVRIKTPSPLVLVAIGLGMAPAEAIELVAARAAESARLSALAV